MTNDIAPKGDAVCREHRLAAWLTADVRRSMPAG